MIWPMPDDQLRALSVRLEQQTGFDSIPTIEEFYRTRNLSPYEDDPGFGCLFPTCERRTRSSTRMWHHVHWQHSPKSFPIKFADLTVDYRAPEAASV